MVISNSYTTIPNQGRTNIGWRVKLHPQPNFWKRAKRAMSQPIFSLRAKLIILAAKILLWSAIAASCSCCQPKILKRAVFTYTVFRVRRITFFLVNRVENQNEPKRPQSGGRLGSFWFSTRPSADSGTDYNQDFDYGTNWGVARQIVP